MSKSKRSRCRGRQPKTFQNKLSKLQSKYSHLFKVSQASQTTYLAVPKEDRKSKDKVFFCDKYPSFQKFLNASKLRQIGNESNKPRPSFNKKDEKKKTTVWGR